MLRISSVTNDRRYLEPVPPALAYLQRSVLTDGRLARYYELRTNRPIVRRFAATSPLWLEDGIAAAGTDT
ncbi:MAG: hypothetical protein P8J37_16205 [Fuerstiella sp.]|nr:hypothetical protein [Fuerstiella sp.]